MTNAISGTAAQILEGMRPMQIGAPVSAGSPVSQPLTSLAAASAESLPTGGSASTLQRFRFNRELKKALESYAPVVIDHTVRVLIARELDRIDAVADQHSLHVLVRKGHHGQHIVAAGQRLDEKLMEIEECGQDRWAEALARRIVALASQKAEGLLTDDQFRQAADFAVARHQEMRKRLSARVDSIRQVTDALVEFGRGEAIAKKGAL